MQTTNSNGKTNGNGKQKQKTKQPKFITEVMDDEPEQETTAEEVVFPKKKGAKTKAPTQITAKIEIPAINVQEIVIPVLGTSSLIVNNFSEKAKRQIEDKQQQKAALKKAAKNPEQDFRGACYESPEHPGCHGFKAVAFKQACVGACRYIEGVSMTYARGAFMVLGDIVTVYDAKTKKPIKIDKSQMRTDMVRVGTMNKVADVRYRPEIKNWMIPLHVRFNANAINLSQVINLLRIAGMSVGVGEWRPEKNGQFGTFEVPDNFEALAKNFK